MQSKLVENWLTSAKELSFTAPFVQLLLAEGYTVIRSKGGSGEQGKDVIARDKSGTIHCFQLKCGDIGTKQWQSINGQINDLTGIAPTHSTIVKAPKTWECHLVTNGDITEPIQSTIVSYSSTNVANGRMPLRTISKDELLRRFSDAFGHFFPIEPSDIRIFFNLYCENGDNTLKHQVFKQYLERFLAGIDATRSKQKKLEAIQATPILASYLLTDKYSKENYIALIDAWILTLLTILYYADKWSIDERKYLATERLILDEIKELASLLMRDVMEDKQDYIDTDYGVLSEPIIVHRLRCTELFGYISAFINYSILSGEDPIIIDDNFSDKLVTLARKKIILSESGLPQHFNSIIAATLVNHTESAVNALKSFVDGVLQTHADDGPGLLSPYYTTEQAVAYQFEMGDPIDESFHNRSYMLWTAILLMARFNQREFLNERWVTISQIAMEEIAAHSQNDLLLWSVDNATMIDTFPNAQQSWSDLVAQATKSYDDDIPPILLKRKHLIPLMVLAMPHRLTPKLILSLLN